MPNPTPQPLTEDEINTLRCSYDLLHNRVAATIQLLKSQLQAEKETSKRYSTSFDIFKAAHEDEKLDTSTRLGYPMLEPWAAADKVVAENKALKQQVEASKKDCYTCTRCGFEARVILNPHVCAEAKPKQT